MMYNWKTFPKIFPNDDFMVMVCHTKKLKQKKHLKQTIIINQHVGLGGFKILGIPPGTPNPPPCLYERTHYTFRNIHWGVRGPVASPCGQKIPSSLRIEYPSCDFLPSDVSTVVLSAKWFSSWWFPSTHLKNMRKSNWIISPSRDEHKNYLKPPTRKFKGQRFCWEKMVNYGLGCPPAH